MIKKFLFSFAVFMSATVFVMSFTVQKSHATVFCDNLGNCSGTNQNGDSVHLYNNGLGNISGNIGDDSVHLYDNGLGNISGTVGDERVNIINDGF